MEFRNNVKLNKLINIPYRFSFTIFYLYRQSNLTMNEYTFMCDSYELNNHTTLKRKLTFTHLKESSSSRLVVFWCNDIDDTFNLGCGMLMCALFVRISKK